MLTETLTRGFEKVYQEDMESQTNFITTIASEVRGMDPKILFEMNAVYIPNNDYMKFYWGSAIMEPKFDCYRNYEECNWANFMIFPIRDILDNIVGIVGFNPTNKLLSYQEETFHLNAYRHSNKSVLNKSLFFFGPKGSLKRAIEQGYMILTDGVFDTISCTQEDLIANAALGSFLSDEQKTILNCIETIYLAEDNDEAGLKMAQQLRSFHRDVRLIKFNKVKDIDNIINSKYKEEFLKVFKSERELNIKRDIRLRLKD
ncbi:toprim domain-containing protein [Paraclostridium bifermentans]|uniref:toprim domain-containing protein n=1 Tax=Paraclostridium bifermentans TaxID=1490 RepID=UPI00374E5A72